MKSESSRLEAAAVRAVKLVLRVKVELVEPEVPVALGALEAKLDRAEAAAKVVLWEITDQERKAWSVRAKYRRARITDSCGRWGNPRKINQK